MVAVSSGNDNKLKSTLDDATIDSLLVTEVSCVIGVGVINTSKLLSVIKSTIVLVDDDITKD